MTPLQIIRRIDGHNERLRDERFERGRLAIAIGMAIGGKDVTTNDVFRVVTGENLPGHDPEDDPVLGPLIEQSHARARAAREAAAKEQEKTRG